jgi:hypothetical protein
MHKCGNIKQRSNDKGHNSYWIYVGLYIGLLVWIKIWKSLCINIIKLQVWRWRLKWILWVSSQNDKDIRNRELAWSYWRWFIYMSIWIKLKLDWSQCSYQEDIQAMITILKKRFSMDAQHDVTWVWLDKVKIARKDLRGTKRRSRSSSGLKTELPWLRWRREYLHSVEVLIELWGVILCEGSNHCSILNRSDMKPWIELICVEMVQVTCSKCVCSKRWDKDDCNPLWRDIEKKWHMKTLKTQVVEYVIFFWTRV